MSDITFLALYLVSAVISGVIGGLIGQYKARARAGFWLGLLIGPFGWLIVLLLPHANYIKCPHCGGELPRRQPECAHCKNRVSWNKDGSRAFKPSSLVRG